MSNTPIVLDKTVYSVSATAVAGRAGKVTTDDGSLDLELVMPGSGKPGPNPEALFAAGYAGCFSSAIQGLARRQKITTGPMAVTMTVGLGPSGETWGLSVKIRVALPELPRAQAQELLEAAHRTCPYSNAIKGNVGVDIALAE